MGEQAPCQPCGVVGPQKATSRAIFPPSCPLIIEMSEAMCRIGNRLHENVSAREAGLDSRKSRSGVGVAGSRKSQNKLLLTSSDFGLSLPAWS